MTTQKPEPVAVEQGDRDRAWPLRPWHMTDTVATVRAWSAGEYDGLDILQSYARHRLAERARLTTDRSLGAVPDGWALAPVAPTIAMVAVGERAAWDDDNHMPAINMVPAIYAAMLAATPPVPAISGEGEKHEYGPSRVGHGEAQCIHCLATNRENAVIAPNICPARAALATPDAAPIGSDDAGGGA